MRARLISVKNDHVCISEKKCHALRLTTEQTWRNAIFVYIHLLYTDKHGFYLFMSSTQQNCMRTRWISRQDKLFNKAGCIINAVCFPKALYGGKLGDTFRTKKYLDTIDAIETVYTRSCITEKLSHMKTKQFIIARIYKNSKIKWSNEI